MLPVAVLLATGTTAGQSPDPSSVSLVAPLASPVARSSPEADFAVRYQNVVSRLAINVASVMPGDSLRIGATGDQAGNFSLRAPAGTVRRIDERTWTWRAPDSASYVPLVVSSPDGADSIRIQAFVLVPISRIRGEVLNGYRIGHYPKVPLRDIYRAPSGFIEVTAENENTLVSPHFRLRDFLCKQAGDHPKYVVLDPLLLLKLELILLRVNEAGYSTRSLFIMSGYRTPYYNRSIGNSEWSRHKWGAAADIFIDENPRDGIMDDLNGDGRVNVKDADVLAGIIEAESRRTGWQRFLGGLGIYRTKPNHGPFVHVDIRGRKARWRGN